VALTRDVFAAEDLKAGRVVRPFDGSHPVEFAVYIVTPPALTTMPKIKAFRDWLFDEARGMTDATPAKSKPKAGAKTKKKR
jgi:LysR family glycine cleavage system transcriptional activator